MKYIESFDMFPAYIGLTKQGMTKFQSKFGGCYTILVLLLTLVYAIIIIIEPLKANSSSANNIGNLASSVGTGLSETVTINGVKFSGTNEVK